MAPGQKQKRASRSYSTSTENRHGEPAPSQPDPYANKANAPVKTLTGHQK